MANYYIYIYIYINIYFCLRTLWLTKSAKVEAVGVKVPLILVANLTHTDGVQHDVDDDRDGTGGGHSYPDDVHDVRQHHKLQHNVIIADLTSLLKPFYSSLLL